jgi:hypothetical protein
MCLYIDGMDQAKTYVPKKPYKDTSEDDVLHCKLTGCLVYRKAIHSYGYFLPGKKFQADSNANLESLRRVLEDIAQSRNGQLPKKLYIQMDNTCKDNKNWIVFTYLASLVLLGYAFPLQLL